MTKDEAIAVAIVSFDFIAELGERPGARPLEVGFRHSDVTEKEFKSRLLEDISMMAETAKAAADKLRKVDK